MTITEEQFERLYEEHAAGLFAFLVYRTGDSTLAEDVMADAFERVLRGRRRFDRRKGSEKTWLYAIALNCLRDQVRRSVAEVRALERTGGRAYGTESPQFDTVEGRDEVMRALRTLTTEEREAIALRYGADLTVPEIAKIIREPLSTAEGRVYRALAKLREEMS